MRGGVKGSRFNSIFTYCYVGIVCIDMVTIWEMSLANITVPSRKNLAATYRPPFFHGNSGPGAGNKSQCIAIIMHAALSCLVAAGYSGAYQLYWRTIKCSNVIIAYCRWNGLVNQINQRGCIWACRCLTRSDAIASFIAVSGVGPKSPIALLSQKGSQYLVDSFLNIYMKPVLQRLALLFWSP